jgi:hypothetical protein
MKRAAAPEKESGKMASNAQRRAYVIALFAALPTYRHLRTKIDVIVKLLKMV